MRHNGFEFPDEDTECHPVVFHELHKIDLILPLCGNKVVVQAGGNVGVFPDYLKAHFAKVITFEPDDENYACLERNVSGVTAYHAGLSDREGLGHVVGDKKNCGALQVEPGGDIALMTIDSLAVNPDLIYLDIEGYEYKALVGAKETIERCHPLLVLENKGLIDNFPSNFDGSDDFREFVRSLGYRYHSRMMRDDVFCNLSV